MQSKLNGVILHFPCAGFLFLIAVTLFINDNNIINMIYLKKVLNYNHQWSLCLPWKLEIQVALSAIFFMKTLRHETPTKVYICDYQMSIVQHFSVDSINSEFGNKKKVEF